MGEAAADPAMLRELIRLAFVYRGRAGFPTSMTPTALQKTLYELRRKLPEQSPVRGCLQYYWFKAGAYSEHVAREQAAMVEGGILSSKAIQAGTLLSLSSEYEGRRLVVHDESMAEARGLLPDIMSFSPQGVIRSQYEDDAPSEFYPRFKLDYMPHAESYHKAVERGARTGRERSGLVALLSEATASLPIDSRFSGFKRAYFDFETAFCRVMQCDMEEYDPAYREMIGDIVSLNGRIWDAFAHGARLVRHDPAYGPKLDAWKSLFDGQVLAMSSEVSRFYFNVLEKIRPRDFDERAVSIDALIDTILSYRRNAEIAFIDFREPQTGKAALCYLGEDAAKSHEASTLAERGQLDWGVIRKMSDDQLSSVMRTCVGSEPVSVAFSGGGTEVVTYRIKPSSLCAAASS